MIKEENILLKPKGFINENIFFKAIPYLRLMNNYNFSIFFFFLCTCSIWAQDFEKTKNSISTSVNAVDIEIQFYSPEIVRVIKHPKKTNFTKQSLSVIKSPETVAWESSATPDEITVKSSSVRLTINKHTGKITFFNLDGDELLMEKDYGSQFTPTKDSDEEAYIVRQAFLLDTEEAVYGLGQFQEGKMIQRNQKLLLRQDNKETVVPVLQSIKGYGLFWDNYSPTYFTDNPQETSFESEVGEGIDYYFMYGQNADGVIADMRDLTGEAPMFPYWTFGYWQSKERYQSQQELVGVVKKYRELGVPLDGIIQDWQYWGDNYHWNAMKFLNPEFPDPKKMIAEVHDLNAHIIISVWASFGPETPQYKIFDKKGMLFDFTTWPIRAVNTWPSKPTDPFSGVKVYDPYNPEARDIYWEYLNKGIFSLGMDGWWLDSTEPDHLNIEEKDFDNKTFLGSFRKVRNAFPLMTVGGVYDHQRKETSDKRVFILTRSAFAGQQRYGANSWSGDVVSGWPQFRKQVSAGLNFSLTGIPYWNSDIGGFFAGGFPQGVQNPSYKELYVRWLQFGTFSTMMRSHGTDTPREIYQFGKKGDWAYDAIEKYINLRYRLLPYIYSTAWEVTSKSSSMMRALMMDFPQDKKALDLDTEYMFGKSILVNPVTESLYFDKDKKANDFTSVKTQKVYLPAGTDWFDFWTGEKLEGGQEVEKEIPMAILPLYIKAGSILPMGPFVQYANQKNGPIEIRVYPGANGEFTLYDDEKDNYNYEKGMFSLINFNWDDAKQKLTIGAREGSFSGMTTKMTYKVILVDKDNGTGLSNVKKAKTVTYSGKKMTVKL